MSLRKKPVRAGWPGQKPYLTRTDGEAILEAAKPIERDWLMIRLIMESGLKTGNIVGNRYPGTNVPPLRLSDLGENWVQVWIHGKRAVIDVNPELIILLKEFYKKNPNREQRIFQMTPGGFRHRVDVALRKAKIKDVENITPDSLKLLLKPEVPRFILHLREHFHGDIATAEEMAQYYIANYALENSIRRLIRETLNKSDSNWWENRVPNDIKKYVKERQDEELQTPRSRRSSEPLDYTTFGHLSNIIDTNWSDFKDKIRSQEAMREILSELNELRAVIAHSCAFSDREKDRLNLRVRDWEAALISPTRSFPMSESQS